MRSTCGTIQAARAWLVKRWLWQAAERLAAIVTFWSDRKVFDAEAVAACRSAIGAPGEAPPGLTQAPAAQPASAPGSAPSGATGLPGAGAPAGAAPYQAQPGGMPFGAGGPYAGQYAAGPAPGAAGFAGAGGAWAPAAGAPGAAAQVRNDLPAAAASVTASDGIGMKLDMSDQCTPSIMW